MSDAATKVSVGKYDGTTGHMSFEIALDVMKRGGKVRAIGISNFGALDLRFVGLDHIQVVDCQTSFFEGQLRCRHRTNAHVFGINAGVGISHQTGQWLDATCEGEPHQ